MAPPFTAADPNDDVLTYSLVIDIPGTFTINAETGEVLMGSFELPEGSPSTRRPSASPTDTARTATPTAPTDDTLDLTMTIVNPNIVVQPSSRATFPNGLWVDDDIVVNTNSGSRDWALYYDRDTQQHLEDRSFRIRTGRFSTMRGVWSDGTTLYVLTADRNRTNPRGKIFAYQLSRRAAGRSLWTSPCPPTTPTPQG